MRIGWAVVALVLVSTPSAGATIDGGETAAGPAAPIRLAQAEGPVIEAPRRITTNQDTIDVTGRVDGLGSVMLSVNGDPVMVDADGSFRVRRVVPVGLTRLMLIAEDRGGGQTEHRILVRRQVQAAETVDFGGYHALVIGNNDYRDLTDLETAMGDAEAIVALLAERYGFEVEVLTNATRYGIVSALGAPRAALTETDSLLIYHAGHGEPDVDSDEGYWLPVDAERDNVANWLSNATITGQIKAMRATHVMVVADSCFSGKLTRGAETAVETGGERSAWLMRMAARRSRTALTSGGLEPVLDAGGGGHSVFAEAFLEALEAFIKAHPDHDLTDNAYFWLGDSFFSRKSYKPAARAYARDFDRFPTADKAPALLLKLAASLAKSDNKGDACTIFKNDAKTVPKASRGEKKQAKTLAKRIDC